MEKSFILFLGQHMPAFIVAADPFMGIAERVAPRKTFALHMAVFDEKLLVLETDVLVFFDPVFASGADRIVDVENPDHFSFVSFHSFSSLVIPAQVRLICISPICRRIQRGSNPDTADLALSQNIPDGRFPAKGCCCI